MRTLAWILIEYFSMIAYSSCEPARDDRMVEILLTHWRLPLRFITNRVPPSATVIVWTSFLYDGGETRFDMAWSPGPITVVSPLWGEEINAGRYRYISSPGDKLTNM